MPGNVTLSFASVAGEIWDTNEGTLVFVNAQKYDVALSSLKETERYSVTQKLAELGQRAVWKALSQYGEEVDRILKFKGTKKAETGLAGIDLWIGGKKKRLTVLMFWAVFLRLVTMSLTDEDRQVLATGTLKVQNPKWAAMLQSRLEGFQDDAQLEDRVWKDFVRVTDLHQEQHLPTVDLDLIRNTFFTFYKATLEFGIRTFPELRRSFYDDAVVSAREDQARFNRSKDNKRAAKLTEKQSQDQRDAEQLPADERLHDDDDAAGIADAVDLDAAQQTLLSDEEEEVMDMCDVDLAAGYSTSDTESTYVESQTQVDEDKAAESFAAGKEALPSFNDQQMSMAPAADAAAKPVVQGAALRKSQAMQHLPIPPANLHRQALPPPASSLPASACAALPSVQQPARQPAGKKRGSAAAGTAATKPPAPKKRPLLPGQQTLLGSFTKRPAS